MEAGYAGPNSRPAANFHDIERRELLRGSSPGVFLQQPFSQAHRSCCIVDASQ